MMPQRGSMTQPIETFPAAQSPTNNAVNRSGEVVRI